MYKKLRDLPAPQGLYDPAYEHDACGIGFVVNIKGEKSYGIIDDDLTILENLKHRGAEGADAKSGDGAGILVQIPHQMRHPSIRLGVTNQGYARARLLQQQREAHEFASSPWPGRKAGSLTSTTCTR